MKCFPTISLPCSLTWPPGAERREPREVMSTPRITTLENGLRVVSEDMPHLETASVGVWVDAGARNESRDANGISHLLEHLFFKGTTTRSTREVNEMVESVGGTSNAFTTREYTCLYAKVLDAHLPLAVDLVSDILLN